MEAGLRLIRSGTLPDCGGVPTTVAVTIPISWLREQTARVTTTLGVDLSARQFLQIACEADIIPVVLNDAGGVMSYGRTKRFPTPAQTRALWARDRGCSFPECTRPPEWCQRHHVEAWTRDHGNTDIDDLTLACGYHHRGFESWRGFNGSKQHLTGRGVVNGEMERVGAAEVGVVGASGDAPGTAA